MQKKLARLTPAEGQTFDLRVPYDKQVIKFLKRLPTTDRRWLRKQQTWRIKARYHTFVIAALRHLFYEIHDESPTDVTQDTAPGFWLLGLNPKDGAMQVHCPVCWCTHGIAHYGSYTDISGATRIQFVSECGHGWELCFGQAPPNHDGLGCWTEIIYSMPVDFEKEDVINERPRSRTQKALDAQRERRLGNDFDEWFETAMSDGDEDWTDC